MWQSILQFFRPEKRQILGLQRSWEAVVETLTRDIRTTQDEPFLLNFHTKPHSVLLLETRGFLSPRLIGRIGFQYYNILSLQDYLKFIIALSCKTKPKT